MTTLTKPLSNDIREEILRLAAGEESRKETPTLLSENRFVEGREVKLMLSFMIEELRGEFKILRDDVNYLRQCMRDNCLEYIKLQEEMKEMKAELQYIRHVESYSQTQAQTSQSMTHVDNKECQYEIVDT
jgi:hypothetical protein